MITENEINHLLYSIPDNIDYTTIMEEIDLQDMPSERIDKLIHIINYENNYNIYDVFKSAGILCSMGVDRGFEYIENLLLTNKYKSFLDKNLNNGDYEYILRVIKSYWASQATLGSGSKARERIYPCLRKIIAYSKIKNFSISRLYWIIYDQKFYEYIPLIKDYLSCIINNKERYWDIYDASELLLELDPNFVIDLFNKNGLQLSDFGLVLPNK